MFSLQYIWQLADVVFGSMLVILRMRKHVPMYTTAFKFYDSMSQRMLMDVEPTVSIVCILFSLTIESCISICTTKVFRMPLNWRVWLPCCTIIHEIGVCPFQLASFSFSFSLCDWSKFSYVELNRQIIPTYDSFPCFDWWALSNEWHSPETLIGRISHMSSTTSTYGNFI